MIFFITGIAVWLFILFLAGLILWGMLPSRFRNFLPNLWYVISCLWGDAQKKHTDINMLIARRGGNTNWFMRAAKWILSERVSR